eukprot:GHVT01086149.1.p3 GENE.GHVT01086149.1~~GHVT01086149.1.p3  ORF type:complete len:157 (+),score=52.29 GHVT01086149.1:361-831(+)
MDRDQTIKRLKDQVDELQRPKPQGNDELLGDLAAQHVTNHREIEELKKEAQRTERRKEEVEASLANEQRQNALLRLRLQELEEGTTSNSHRMSEQYLKSVMVKYIANSQPANSTGEAMLPPLKHLLEAKTSGGSAIELDGDDAAPPPTAPDRPAPA